MEIIIGILAFVLLILFYVIYNLYHNLEVQETLAEEREKWILELTNRINLIKQELIVLDKRGSFSSDDEIGFFFKRVQDMSAFLNEMIEIGEE